MILILPYATPVTGPLTCSWRATKRTGSILRATPLRTAWSTTFLWVEPGRVISLSYVLCCHSHSSSSYSSSSVRLPESHGAGGRRRGRGEGGKAGSASPAHSTFQSDRSDRKEVRLLLNVTDNTLAKWTHPGLWFHSFIQWVLPSYDTLCSSPRETGLVTHAHNLTETCMLQYIVTF